MAKRIVDQISLPLEREAGMAIRILAIVDRVSMARLVRNIIDKALANDEEYNDLLEFFAYMPDDEFLTEMSFVNEGKLSPQVQRLIKRDRFGRKIDEQS